jgi:hypothetical protein
VCGVEQYGEYGWCRLLRRSLRLPSQEILLAGCPVVVVRTGVPFIQDGVSGVFVDRLPSGAKCVKNVADEVALATFVEGIRRVQQTDCHSVRARGVDAFATSHRRSTHRSFGNGEFPWRTHGRVNAYQGERRHSDFGPMYWVATTTSSYQTVRVVPPPVRV